MTSTFIIVKVRNRNNHTFQIAARQEWLSQDSTTIQLPPQNEFLQVIGATNAAHPASNWMQLDVVVVIKSFKCM